MRSAGIIRTLPLSCGSTATVLFSPVMATFRILLPIALLIGCSGGGDDESSFTCERTDRAGTYFAEFETLSGNCGEQASGLIRLEPGVIGECAELSPPLWSDGNCKLETHQSCPVGAGLTVETVGVTTQQDETADVITGTMTMTIDELGSFVCTGTYRLTATRQ